MRIGVIADIHVNLEALTAVLNELKKQGIDRLFVVGDLVGYGADPGPCIDLVMNEEPTVVAGNHDWAAVGKADIAAFNEAARIAVLCTTSQLSDAQAAVLADLCLELRQDDVHLVHASPCLPDRWDYLIDLYDARRAISCSDRKICVVGHSHVPFIYARGEEGEMFVDEAGMYAIQPGWRYLVNVGSIGQPRDGNAQSSVVIIDQSEAALHLLRVPYQVERAQAKIRAVPELPEFLAQRLAWGY